MDEIEISGSGDMLLLQAPEQQIVLTGNFGPQGPPGTGVEDLAPVALSGSYDDLTGTPTIPTQYTDVQAAAAAPVQSVAGRTGTVTLTKTDVGLSNVDNTSDAAKPVSTATQSALDAKAATTYVDNQDSAEASARVAGDVSMASTAQTNLTAHTRRTDNPHTVTKAQVGLSNVPNTDATARANHTGTQAISTVAGLQTTLDDKQQKIAVTVGSGAADYLIDGTADNVQIQTAMDAVSLLGGGEVRLLDHGYGLASALSMPSNVALIGSRSGRTVLTLANSTNTGMITNSGSRTGIVLENLTFNGNSANQTTGSAAISLSNVTLSRLTNVRVTDSKGDGIRLTGCTDVELDGVISTANAVGGIRLLTRSYCKIRRSESSYNVNLGIALASTSDYNEVIDTYIGHNGSYGLLGGTATDTLFNKYNRFIRIALNLTLKTDSS